MPFDGTKPLVLTRLQKLERLLEIAEKATGSQGTYCQCVHHDALGDPLLVASGLPPNWRDDDFYDQCDRWLRGCNAVFGVSLITKKRLYLRNLIAAERAKGS